MSIVADLCSVPKELLSLMNIGALEFIVFLKTSKCSTSLLLNFILNKELIGFTHPSADIKPAQ